MKELKKILALNTGSSSIKFALYETGEAEKLLLTGSLIRIGHEGGGFVVRDDRGITIVSESVTVPDHDAACDYLFSWLVSQGALYKPDAIGHRMVHGGPHYSRPQVVSPELIASLEELVPYAPEHLPQALKAVGQVSKLFPGTLQVMCFDTSFHTSMPSVARFYPLPESIRSEGVRRYGFHGLSYEYLLSELERQGGSEAARGRIILAHLGHGASMAAVKEHRSIDTTMGFSPAGGLVMSTRTGDLDPGVILFLLQQDKMNAAEIKAMVNRQSGLLGISGISDDMQVLLSMESQNLKAREAVDMFCYRAKMCLGSYAAVMGGLDTLVFSGGIGEHAAEIRRRICEGLGFLGVFVEASRNVVSSPVISPDGSAVTVRVIATNEELMIVRHTLDIVAGTVYRP
ncbi:MAG: acetate/propionate family kinase [Chlorobiaceae bacterium]|nr:acetate/propionate family kinase [Chlorobiaceae bacterium]NTV16583.1 acetate/propionate family kinase [Chlorobiaceae bacterium]